MTTNPPPIVLSCETPSFETWYEQLRGHVRNQAGIELEDLPDQLYKDWWTDGITPTDAYYLIMDDEDFSDLDLEHAYTSEVCETSDADPGL